MLVNFTKEEIELLKNAIYVAQQECQLPEPGDDGYEEVKAILDKFEDAQRKEDFAGEHQGIASGSVAYNSPWLNRNFSLSLTDRG